jgi:hypothetical protein
MMPYYAQALNQYGKPIGDAQRATKEEAIAAAREKAYEALRTANKNWKWRIAKIKVTQWS